MIVYLKMAIRCKRCYYKYAKCFMIPVIIFIFIQLLIAINFIPTDSGNYLTLTQLKPYSNHGDGDVSARKLGLAFGDDEDLHQISSSKKSVLRIEELDFKPACDIQSREAISAIHRAKSQMCKQLILNKTCLIQSGNFYPRKLPNSCPSDGNTYGKHIGCYQDEKKMRLLSSFYGNYASTNTPTTCLDICVQAGFPYAGVQYASECFCGENPLPTTAKVDEMLCDMKCPGDQTKTCGGYFMMSVYETGLKKFTPQIPKVTGAKKGSVRIVFLLSLNGRALRQVHRLINVLYRSTHYFYIHVDARQDYLHRELSVLEKQFPNIKLASERFSTIWGGASLLEMLLASMRDFFELGWKWDFVINLSESDFPIKSLESLEDFLVLNKGLNFVKSHGREVQRFIKKQGLDKTFVECESHMWRVGPRSLPAGIVLDGGSDWLALSPAFVKYLVHTRDSLLVGLHTLFRHTLLPAESYFHTALRNSAYCGTYVDNNLHVTNWKRKLGCKCQHRSVVDWCGCSPNDFRADDWPRIHSTADRQLFFARKFEPVVDQEIVTRVERSIGIDDHHLIRNLEAYWQSVYHREDVSAGAEDALLTHTASVVRLNAKILLREKCFLSPGEILEINSYHYADIYKGNLILHKVSMGSEEAVIETWYKPHNRIEFNRFSPYIDNVKIFKVSSDYDQKEQSFRNLANVLGPLSEPVLLYNFASPFDKSFQNLSVVWLDAAGVVADVNQVYLQENNLTNFIAPNIKRPLLPGIWRVGLFRGKEIVVQTEFLITPLQVFSGKKLTENESAIVHGGSQNSYTNFSHINLKNFTPSHNEIISLQNIAMANAKRLGLDLLEWIDNLSNKFYKVLGSCINVSSKLEGRFSCGNHNLEFCSLSEWSSLSPDPKGYIGRLNKVTGKLERV